MNTLLYMTGWPSLGAEDVIECIGAVLCYVAPIVGLYLLLKLIAGICSQKQPPRFFFKMMASLVLLFLGWELLQNIVHFWFPMIGVETVPETIQGIPYGSESLILGMIVVNAGTVVLGGLFLYTLYSKWILDHMTDEERQPGIDGIRAWLSDKNLLCAVGLAILLSLSFDVRFLEYFLLFILLLIAFPLISMLSRASQRPSRMAEDLHQARQKILDLLDKGTITAAESHDLLTAIGEPGTSQSR